MYIFLFSDSQGAANGPAHEITPSSSSMPVMPATQGQQDEVQPPPPVRAMREGGTNRTAPTLRRQPKGRCSATFRLPGPSRGRTAPTTFRRQPQGFLRWPRVEVASRDRRCQIWNQSHLDLKEAGDRRARSPAGDRRARSRGHGIGKDILPWVWYAARYSCHRPCTRCKSRSKSLI